MTLELKGLSDEEQVALVALIEGVVGADGHATDGETKQLRTLVAALGKKNYRAAAEQAAEAKAAQERAAAEIAAAIA